ncbi:unnamed protein product [Ectocarpus sp. 12 AP-2014]
MAWTRRSLYALAVFLAPGVARNILILGGGVTSPANLQRGATNLSLKLKAASSNRSNSSEKFCVVRTGAFLLYCHDLSSSPKHSTVLPTWGGA